MSVLRFVRVVRVSVRRWMRPLVSEPIKRLLYHGVALNVILLLHWMLVMEILVDRVTCEICMKRRWTVKDDWTEPVRLLCGLCFLQRVTWRNDNANRNSIL